MTYQYNHELNLMPTKQVMHNLYKYDLIEMQDNKSCFIDKSCFILSKTHHRD